MWCDSLPGAPSKTLFYNCAQNSTSTVFVDLEGSRKWFLCFYVINGSVVTGERVRMFLFLGGVAEAFRRGLSAFCNLSPSSVCVCVRVCACVCTCARVLVRLCECTARVDVVCALYVQRAGVQCAGGVHDGRAAPRPSGQEEEASVSAGLGPGQRGAVLASSLVGHQRRQTNRKTGPAGPRAWPWEACRPLPRAGPCRPCASQARVLARARAGEGGEEGAWDGRERLGWGGEGS